MARQKSISDENIVIALMEHGTVTAAAKTLDCNPCTIYSRQSDPEFLRIYKRAKAESIRTATAKLSTALDAAFDTLIDVMQDEKTAPKERIQAAGMIINNHAKYIALLENFDTVSEKAESNSFIDDAINQLTGYFSN